MLTSSRGRTRRKGCSRRVQRHHWLRWRKKDGAGPLVRRQKVAGFSNDEEKTVGVYGKVLNVLEIKFKELGAKCVEVENLQAACYEGRTVGYGTESDVFRDLRRLDS